MARERAQQRRGLSVLSSNVCVLLFVLVAGTVLGVAQPNTKMSHTTWAILQSATGWSYTLAWSLSFWPQVIQNYRRKDVSGISLDYLALNLLGWIAYATFNAVIFFRYECPSERRPRVGAAAAAAPAAPATVFLGAGPRVADVLGATDFCQFTVELNDVVFATHALVLTLVTAVQCAIYPGSKHQRVHAATGYAIAAAGGLAAAAAAAIAFDWPLPPALARWQQWVYWLYLLSFMKMGVTLIKYIPQAVLNCRRRSTDGWSVLNVLLDLEGGVLSLGQQLVTCSWTGNYEPITANPVKLGLAVTSIGYDLLLSCQHYVYYASGRRAASRADAAALRRLRGVLGALSAGAAERLPFEVAEDALLTLGEAGIDAGRPKELRQYADDPSALPPAALERLLAAPWCAAAPAAGATAGDGLRVPLLAAGDEEAGGVYEASGSGSGSDDGWAPAVVVVVGGGAPVQQQQQQQQRRH